MSILMTEMEIAKAQNVTVAEDSITFDLVDGHTVSVPVAWYPRILHGTPEE